jgi:hypothetical protein
VIISKELVAWEGKILAKNFSLENFRVLGPRKKISTVLFVFMLPESLPE